MLKKINKRRTKKGNADTAVTALSQEVLIKTREALLDSIREIQVILDHPLNDLTPQEVFKLKGCLRENGKALKKAIKEYVKLL
jgi:hypothetical protein